MRATGFAAWSFMVLAVLGIVDVIERMVEAIA